jgi:hypothetical protein
MSRIKPEDLGQDEPIAWVRRHDHDHTAGLERILGGGEKDRDPLRLEVLDEV